MKSNIWDKSVPVEENYYYHKGDPFLLTYKKTPKNNLFNLVDLFCGCGGFSVGFQMAGFQTITGCDIHPPSIETFQRNHPTANMITGDIKNLTDYSILKSTNGFKVNVITAGVPCQGFSLNNRKRNSDDKRNFLFLEFIRVIKILDPDVVVLENVSGLASTAKGGFKLDIIKSLTDCGYNTDVSIINSADFGVPQKRKRIFFVGTKQNFKFLWPKETHGFGINGLKQWITVWEAIGDLPQINSSEHANKYVTEPFTEYQKWARGNEKDLTNHVAPNHPPETIEKIKVTKPGQPIYPDFKQRIRLHPDLPSPTQVSGGIRPQFQFGHPKSNRGLTIRERCRLQSFPDNFYITGGVTQGRVQTGNAVSPLVAFSLALQIKNTLLKLPISPLAKPIKPKQMILFE